MADTLSTLSIVFFVVGGVCFALAVFFWFFFKIPGVIGDLTGKTARKNIAKIREENEKKSNRAPRDSSRLGIVRRKGGTESLNKTAQPSVRFTSQNANSNAAANPETGLLDSNKDTYGNAENTALLVDNGGASDIDETAPLVEANNGFSDETAPLVEANNGFSEETAPLANANGGFSEETAPLVTNSASPSDETAPLVEASDSPADETKPLVEETGLLQENAQPAVSAPQRAPSTKKLVPLETVMYVHTDEVIQC